MKRWELLDESTQADGNRMTLYRRDGVYVIRVNGADLMSTRQHHSEDVLAQLVCQRLANRTHPRVLIGGLGLGFTARSALNTLGSDAQVVICEISEAVITWNRNPDYGLGHDVLADARVEIRCENVADFVKCNPDSLDGIMLDVDNGPEALSTEKNRALYQLEGLASAKRSLRPKGTVAYWSAAADPKFAKLMKRAGFTVETHKARSHTNSGSVHTIFLGT